MDLVASTVCLPLMREVPRRGGGREIQAETIIKPLMNKRIAAVSPSVSLR